MLQTLNWYHNSSSLNTGSTLMRLIKRYKKFLWTVWWPTLVWVPLAIPQWIRVLNSTFKARSLTRPLEPRSVWATWQMILTWAPPSIKTIMLAAFLIHWSNNINGLTQTTITIQNTSRRRIWWSRYSRITSRRRASTILIRTRKYSMQPRSGSGLRTSCKNLKVQSYPNSLQVNLVLWVNKRLSVKP